MSSPFARRFAVIFGTAAMPAVYRSFILDGHYLPLRRACTRDLPGHGGGDVELRFDHPRLLDPDAMYESAGFDEPDDQHHPIAVLPASSDFLAIRVNDARAPVVLAEHETGAFVAVSDSFEDFISRLRTPAQVRRETTAKRQGFRALKVSCEAASLEAETALSQGRVDDAIKSLDAALDGQAPIPYDGRNDYLAIGALATCYYLNGVCWLVRGDLRRAQKAFADAASCRALSYCDAVLGLSLTSLLLGEPEAALDRAGEVERDDFTTDPATLAQRMFSPAQLDACKAAMASVTADRGGFPLVERLRAWFNE